MNSDEARPLAAAYYDYAPPISQDMVKQITRGGKELLQVIIQGFILSRAFERSERNANNVAFFIRVLPRALHIRASYIFIYHISSYIISIRGCGAGLLNDDERGRSDESTMMSTIMRAR